MQTRMILWSTYALVVLLGSIYLTTTAYAYTEDDFVLGVFPRRNAKVTYKLFKPLQAYMAEKLNRRVKLVISKDFKTFWKKVEDKAFDVVHYNQYHYLISNKKFGYEVILKNKELGEDTIAGSIIVRKDSGYNSVMDLKGKTIVFGGGPKAMQSYIVARWLLQEGGLNKGDYVEKFSKNPPNAIFSSFYHQADASGSGDKVLRLGVVKKQIKIEELKFLARGPQLPHLPWAVKGGMDLELKQQIQDLLANLDQSEEGRKVLKAAKLNGLVKTTDSEYNKHREIVKAVFNETY